MEEKIIFDTLTQNTVSIKKQNFTTINGKEYPIGNIWSKAYINSIRGREELKSEIKDPYLSVVMLIWGNTPTVEEETVISNTQ